MPSINKIDEINKKIMLLNMEAIEGRESEFGSDEMFGIHSYGIRHKGSGRGPIGKREHRWNMWFEKEDARKLHLTHSWRAAILHRIQLYFIHNTEW